MTKRLILPFTLLLAVVLISAGCNLFGWTSKEDSGSLIDDGIKKMRDGDYQGALADFTKAMEKDPSSSDARYYHAKATMSASGFNAFNLGADMTDESDNGGPLPFMGGSWTDEKANKLYSSIATVYDDLKPIYQGKTTGSFTKNDIDLDFGISVGIRGILLFRDDNLDGLINSTDHDFKFVDDNSSGIGFAQGELLGYIEAGGSIAKVAGVAAFDTCAAINAFNMLLDSIDVVITEAHDVIVDVVSENTELNPDDIDSLLVDIINMAHYWRINDPADNDGDGTINEELIDLLDNDGDGLYDEDAVWPSCLPPTR